MPIIMPRFSSTLTRTVCLGLFFCLAATHCTKKEESTSTEAAVEKLTPEQSVERFVRLSATAQSVQDRMKLRDLCQGKLRQAFDKMSDENFQISYLAGGLNISDFKIISSKTESGDSVVHYRVTLHNKQGLEHTQEANEREVSLVQINGVWFLDSIRPAGKDQIAFVNGMFF